MTGPRIVLRASAGSRGAVRSRPRRRTVPSRRGRRSAARWWPAALVTALMLIGVVWSRADGIAAPPAKAMCTIPGTPFAFTGEQVGNAQAIARVAYGRRLPERAVVIALATAYQESGLRNLDYGDRDSLGLFQQRPSMGWGTPAQVRDPTYAAGKFLERLVNVPNWQTRPLWQSADLVQRSARPQAYQRHQSLAIALTAAMADDTLTCG
jgi:hypothetical protein